MSVRIDFIEGSRIALKSLSAHRLRTVLTTVGVGIGVATLLAILGIIQGLNTSFEKQLETIGPASLYISKRPWVQMGNWWEYRNRKNITLEQVEAVRAQSTFAEAIAPWMSNEEDVSFNGIDLTAIDVTGTTPEYAQVSGYDLTQGRFLTGADDDNLSSVAVIGSDVAGTLFPHSSPLGARIRVAGRPFTVVGVLGPKGKVLDENQDLTVLMPLRTFRALHNGQKSHTIGVKVRSPELLDAAEDELVGILRRARETPPGKPDDFAINRAEQLASVYNQLTGALYGVAVAIGFITLLVGGIGIMNIMLVSVRERTREIGVRRALGARKRTIVLQFILEAVVVSAVGGALGTGVGLSGAKIVSWVTPLAATVKASTIFFGVGFAAAVGLIFGIWPAARAANLDPVEALRHE
jgi:putative ABC transport system permease protein